MLPSDKISRMKLKVLFSDDPAFVIGRADKFLSSEPVLHNLILSILHSRVAQGDPGRYWIALHGVEVVGVVVQSPLEYPATLTPMEPRAVLAIADAIAQAGVTLAGVNGDAATAASFAGQWSERCKSAAAPFQGTRLYELLEVGEVPRTAGHLRQAGPRDRSLMILWTRAFQDEIGVCKRHRASRRAGVGRWTDLAVGSKRRDNFYGCWPRTGARRSSLVWGLYATREAKARLRGSLRSCAVETSSRLWVSMHSLHGLGQPYIEFHLPANRI
jgi:hypothetical protein